MDMDAESIGCLVALGTECALRMFGLQVGVVEVVGCKCFAGWAVGACWVHDCHVGIHFVERVVPDVAGCAFRVEV